jgi:glycerol uptake facilitator-like aquaporin
MAKPAETVILPRRLAAEALGTGMLLTTVVGSGIMGDQLAGGNQALALWANTAATAAILVVLILSLGPVSGAHFNPAVTLAFAFRREISPFHAACYIAVQVIAGILGVWLAHAMFNLDIFQISDNARASRGELIGEVVATFNLIFVILGCLAFAPKSVPYGVGLVIAAGYWLTSSTSFANPAVTIARTLTDTFSGIAPGNAPGFVLAELVAVPLVLLAAGFILYPRD